MVVAKAARAKKTAERNYGGLSEADRVSARRKRLLDAGFEVFGTLGIRGTTVRMVCKSAGLTERYFYESFADSDALFCAVYERELRVLQTLFVSHLPSLPITLNERIHAILTIVFNSMRDSRRVRIFYVEALAGSEQVQNMYHYSVRFQAQLSATFIRADNPAVTASNDVLLQVGYAINGAFSSLLVQWMRGGYTTPIEIVVSSAEIFVHGVMRELLERSRAGAS
ncbi:Transcriptional regulator [gamma proteobacterium HdN1]|nr:Transcriptional regulator [gamma proteobacterium HdN1]